MIIDDYTLIKQIGSGQLGKTYLTSKKGLETKYATKVYERRIYSYSFERELLLNEITILKEVYHPNIIKLIDLKKSTKFYFLIFEYCNGGTLQDFLEQYQKKYNKAPSEEKVEYIMRQIIHVIKYLHNKKIVHTNISLDNIMINYEDENDRINNNIMKAKIKIIGFSLASYLKKGEYLYSITGGHINLDPICIFKLNKIPEYKYSGYDEKLDIWSLGIIFYELLIGKNPFDVNSMKELVQKLEKGDYYVPITLSKEALSFLNNMLQFEPKDRLNIDILYNHEFLRKKVIDFTKLKFNEKISEIKLNIKKKQIPYDL